MCCVINAPFLSLSSCLVLVEAKRIASSDTSFEFTYKLFGEPLHAFRPRAFELFELVGGNLEGSPTTAVVRSGPYSRPRVLLLVSATVKLRLFLFSRTPTHLYLISI